MTVAATGQHVDHAALEAWSSDIFAATGMPLEEARIAAEVLVRASLRGIDTHGVSRVPQYAEGLLSGAINPAPQHGGECRDGVLHYRGDGGLGQVIGRVAVREALRLAEDVPVVTCLMQRCGHLGALGLHVLVAAEAGMLGFLCQSTRPFMGLPGWKGPGIGNNPLSFATPLPDRPPLVFDMASSVVARGNLRQAAREGTAIPEGWAIGPDGQPTTDPEIGMAGAVLPFGGYKGLGVAMLVQCLAGSLLGNSKGPGEPAATGSETGAFLLIINPRLAAGGVYGPDTDAWFARFLEAAGPDARYPGRRAADCEMERRRHGIPIARGSADQMRTIGQRLGLLPPFPS